MNGSTLHDCKSGGGTQSMITIPIVKLHVFEMDAALKENTVVLSYDDKTESHLDRDCKTRLPVGRSSSKGFGSIIIKSVGELPFNKLCGMVYRFKSQTLRNSTRRGLRRDTR
ncbi:hypothetical protein SELMODRAFT_425354 [Selaginella moellendorffii]|uniref:Uncharacterized protein n=1 Tax=Selaginella moellendorffii TaxID=88036 RepID=D8SSU2_SELML|nr:hypothetical protein SELMODRAFT_425354 [Selaginella moellendorffii]